jgi:glycosyltransferase involved in cell wall biosynthesis
VGDTDESNPMSVSEEQIAKWEREGIVEWWGFQEDMPAVFAEMHVVCSPTFYREGVPKVLIEAAACERSIVTTDVPGCREIVHDGENGFLVPSKDTDALVAALEKLLENKERRKEMGRLGRQIVRDEFSVEQVVSETMSVYDRLTARGHASTRAGVGQ